MKHNRHNKAFTLAEVILAIGIMGIGMVFAACLFPAAIKESESSSAAMEGSIIAQNGLNIAKQMLKRVSASNPTIAGSQNTIVTNSIGNFTWVDGNITKDNFRTELPTSSLGLSAFYPATNDLSNLPASFVLPNTGYILLLQHQGAATSTEYLAISISYRKRKGGNIEVTSVPFPLASMEKEVTISSSQDRFQRNGLVIVDALSGNSTSGKMARIVGRKGNDVTVEHPLLNSTGSTLTNVIVITESGSQETPILSATSAIININ